MSTLSHKPYEIKSKKDSRTMSPKKVLSPSPYYAYKYSFHHLKMHHIQSPHLRNNTMLKLRYILACSYPTSHQTQNQSLQELETVPWPTPNLLHYTFHPLPKLPTMPITWMNPCLLSLLHDGLLFQIDIHHSHTNNNYYWQLLGKQNVMDAKLTTILIALKIAKKKKNTKNTIIVHIHWNPHF